MNYIAGPGNAETWSPCNGHGNDPRTVERTDDDIESEANAMADSILRAASRAVAGINEPRERLARQVGILQGEIRSLCSQLVWAREGV